MHNQSLFNPAELRGQRPIKRRAKLLTPAMLANLNMESEDDRDMAERHATALIAACEPPKTEEEKKAEKKKHNSDAHTRARIQEKYAPKRAVRNTEDEDNTTGEEYLNCPETISKREDSGDVGADLDAEYRDDVEYVSGAEEDELEVSDESAAGEYSCAAFERQESVCERNQQNKLRKAQADLESARLSAHLLDNLFSTLNAAIPNVIRNPGSDAELAWALAAQEALEKRTGRAKFAERYAAELGTSKSTIERQVREGRNLWANLIQVALGLKLEPNNVIEYLSTLSRSTQLRVAQFAEQHRAEWDVGEEMDRYKRAKRLSNGILNKLPDSKIVERETRLRLTEMTEAQQKKEVAAMRVAEKQKQRKAKDEEKNREFRSNERFAAAAKDAGRVTKAVQSYLSLTPAERADIQSVLGFHSTTQERP